MIRSRAMKLLVSLVLASLALAEVLEVVAEWVRVGVSPTKYVSHGLRSDIVTTSLTLGSRGRR